MVRRSAWMKRAFTIVWQPVLGRIRIELLHVMVVVTICVGGCSEPSQNDTKSGSSQRSSSTLLAVTTPASSPPHTGPASAAQPSESTTTLAAVTIAAPSSELLGPQVRPTVRRRRGRTARAGGVGRERARPRTLRGNGSAVIVGGRCRIGSGGPSHGSARQNRLRRSGV